MISPDNYNIKEVMPNVFLITAKHKYDLAMLFLRYQEYYESPKFHMTEFTLLEFMEWYSKGHDSIFSYCRDWSGFNIPSWAFRDAYYFCCENDDKSAYDEIMAYLLIEPMRRTRPFYVIGITEGDDETLDHEIAHALYYTNSIYKFSMEQELNKLDPLLWSNIYKRIAGHDYHESTIIDEMQAYLATGPSDFIKDLMPKKVRTPFIEIFNNFKNKGI